jgi:hypothetical protein
MIKSPKVTRVLVVRRWTANFAPPHSAEANWQACIGDYDIDLELNELCGKPAAGLRRVAIVRLDDFISALLMSND